MKIKVQTNAPQLVKKLREARREINISILAAMQTNRALMFDAEGAHNDKDKWAPLKLRNGQILSKTGRLRRSWTGSMNGSRGPRGVAKSSGNILTLGTKVHYAVPLNYGAIIRPVKARALKIPTKSGVMFRQKAVIPPRPMNIITGKDEIEFATTMRNKMAGVLNRA